MMKCVDIINQDATLNDVVNHYTRIPDGEAQKDDHTVALVG